MIAPVGSLTLEEHAWNAYPTSKTILTSKYFGDKFNLTIESRHLAGVMTKVDSTSQQLVDIADKNVLEAKDYTAVDDPRMFSSSSYPSPLYGDGADSWMTDMQSHADGMTCYKKVSVECRIFGVQSQLESMI